MGLVIPVKTEQSPSQNSLPVITHLINLSTCEGVIPFYNNYMIRRNYNVHCFKEPFTKIVSGLECMKIMITWADAACVVVSSCTSVTRFHCVLSAPTRNLRSSAVVPLPVSPSYTEVKLSPSGAATGACKCS